MLAERFSSPRCTQCPRPNIRVRIAPGQNYDREQTSRLPKGVSTGHFKLLGARQGGECEVRTRKLPLGSA